MKDNETLLHRARTLIARKNSVTEKMGKIQGELSVIRRNLKAMGVKEVNLEKEIGRRQLKLSVLEKELVVRLNKAEKALRGSDVDSEED